MKQQRLNTLGLCSLLFLIPVFSANAFNSSTHHAPKRSDSREVEVTGRAAVEGSIAHAREHALKDALRLAAQQVHTKVNSQQQIRMGELLHESVTLDSEANVRNLSIVSEGQKGDEYYVSVKAQVDTLPACNNPSRHYRKSVAVTGFTLQQASDAVVGELSDIEQRMPQWLTAQLMYSGQHQVINVTQQSLFANTGNAPTYLHSNAKPTLHQPAVKQLNAQYIVAGVIRSLQMIPVVSMGKRWLSHIGMSQQQRRLAIDIYIYDGFSGALINQNRYQTEGGWPYAHHKKIGFGSTKFWASDYGQQTEKLLRTIQQDISEQLSCQPFMARIIRAQGKRLHIEIDAGSGVRRGDQLSVYRTGVFFDLDNEPQQQLTNSNLQAKVMQVQPHFLIADMPISAENLAIQRDDLIIVW